MQAPRKRAANSLLRTSSNSRLTIKVNASPPLVLRLAPPGSAQCILGADAREKRQRRFERRQPATTVIGRWIPDVLRITVEESKKNMRISTGVRKNAPWRKHNLPPRWMQSDVMLDCSGAYPAKFCNARLNRCYTTRTTTKIVKPVAPLEVLVQRERR